MRVVKLQGGLGNQMFQYAFAKSLGDDVKFDTAWFQRRTKFSKAVSHLSIGLEKFNITFGIASLEEINDCLGETPVSRKLLLLKKYFGMNCIKTNRVYERVRNEYYPRFSELPGNVYFDGYFQNPLYFNSLKERLVLDFSLKSELSDKSKSALEDILCSNSVSISVRHGKDYERLGWCLDAGYYTDAISYLQNLYENLKFFIFSDNEEWCRNNLPVGINARYCQSYDETCGYAAGIVLMSKCSHSICANSSYSWWGGYLNEYRSVLVPQKWLPESPNPFVSVTYKYLVMPDWILI